MILITHLCGIKISAVCSFGLIVTGKEKVQVKDIFDFSKTKYDLRTQLQLRFKAKPFRSVEELLFSESHQTMEPTAKLCCSSWHCQWLQDKILRFQERVHHKAAVIIVLRGCKVILCVNNKTEKQTN